MPSPFRNCKIIGDNIPPEVYLRQDPDAVRGAANYVLSRSALMSFLPCNRRWKNGGGEKESVSLDWGDRIDAAILQPGSFTSRFCIAPATYESDKGEEKEWNWNAKVCKQFRADKEKEGMEVIKKDEYDEIQQALTAFESNEFAMRLLNTCKKQVFVLGEYLDPETGIIVPVKCLIDFQPEKGSEFDRYLGDYKSTKSAAPSAFEGSIFEYGYDVQAWLSTQMFNQATGEQRDSWQFLVQENVAPYEMPDMQPAIFEGGSFMQMGQARCMQALKAYARCVKTGVWPSYSAGGRMTITPTVYVADTDAWMEKKFLAAQETFEESLAKAQPQIHPFDTPP